MHRCWRVGVRASRPWYQRTGNLGVPWRPPALAPEPRRPWRHWKPGGAGCLVPTTDIAGPGPNSGLFPDNVYFRADTRSLGVQKGRAARSRESHS
jgi:hypothetical protein